MPIFKDTFDIVNLTLSILFNLIVFLRISGKKEDSSTNEFTKIIHCHSIVGSLSAIIIYIFKLHIVSNKEYFAIIFDFFENTIFDFTWNRIFYGIVNLCIYTNIGYPVSIMLVRYIVICKRINLSNLIIILIYIYPIIIASLPAILCFLSIKNSVPEGVLYTQLMWKNYDILSLNKNSYSIYGALNSVSMYTLLGGIILFFSLNFTLVIVFYVKYQFYMKKFSSIMSGHTKQMHTEFTRLLLLQSFVPTSIVILPLLYYVFCLIVNDYYYVGIIGTTIHQSLSSVTLVNPLLHLVLSRKNRRDLKDIFKKSFYSLTKYTFKHLGRVNVVASSKINMKNSNNMKGSQVPN